MTSRSTRQLHPAAERIDALDALRGLAVLGIFIINIVGFSMPAADNPLLVGGDGRLNYGLWSLSQTLVAGTMRGLFTLLFGASVVLFAARAEKAGDSIVIADAYYRRTMWLIAFGLLHIFVFLQPGDVLFRYGLAGLVLFPLRRLSPARLALLFSVFLACFFAGTLIATMQVSKLQRQARDIEISLTEGGELTANEQEILESWKAFRAERWPTDAELKSQVKARTGSLATLYLSNAESVPYYRTLTLVKAVANDLMMMLLGMALMKWSILSGSRGTGFYLIATCIGLGAGLPFRVWDVWSSWATNFDFAVTWRQPFLGPARIALTLGYAGAFLAIWRSARRTAMFQPLAAVGRMALTNYFVQTLIANLVFTGLGLGLFGELNRGQAYALMVAVWTFQIGFSVYWLKRFRFGPLEWLWRTLTYWKPQPMVRRPRKL